ncbi:MAG: RNA methyltransferase [Thermodesulfovibrio sp.]|nr:RNA methyltransferase [Thermodesulfovibrio sp.]
MKSIESIENPIIKQILKIKKESKDKIFIEGLNLVKTALDRTLKQDNISLYTVEKILVTESFLQKEDFLKIKLNEIIVISEKIAKKISDTNTPQGIFAIVSYERLNLSRICLYKTKTVVILDKIQDPGNLGTIIRTSEALGAEIIIITPGTCNPFSPKVLRASAGSIFYIPVIKAAISEIENFIKKQGLKLLITDLKAEKLIFELNLSHPLAIVFGNEAHGVSEDFKRLPHIGFRIPHMGRTESLNVAMSASIILYEVLKSKMKGFTQTLI